MAVAGIVAVLASGFCALTLPGAEAFAAVPATAGAEVNLIPAPTATAICGFCNPLTPGAPYDTVGLAVDSAGDLYSAMFGGAAVSVLPTANGTIFGQSVTADVQSGLAGLGSSPQVVAPDALAFDPAGDLFISDWDRGTFVIPAASGTLFGNTVTAHHIAAVKDVNAAVSGGTNPWGIAYYQGMLFEANQASNSVSVLSPTTSTVFGVSVTADTWTNIVASGVNEPEGGLNDPDGLAFDGNGNLFISNYGGDQGGAGEGTESSISVLAASSTTVFGQSVAADQLTEVTEALDTAAGSAALAGASQITFHNGNLYIANEVGDAVSVLPSSSSQIGGVTVTADELNTIYSSVQGSPWGLAFDGNGDLYVALFNSFAGQYNASTFLAVLPTATGNLFGNPVTAGTWGSLSSPGYPTGMVFDNAGNLYVAAYKSGTVSVLPASSGTLFGVPVTAGVLNTLVTGLTDPEGLAFSGGNLYIANSGVNTITVLPTTTGTLFGVPVVAGQKHTLVTTSAEPFGLAFDAAGNLYIANNSAQTVSVLPANTGTLFGESVVQDTLHTLVTTAQGLSYPQGLAFDPNGNLYIADYGSGMISILPTTSGSLLGNTVTADDLTTFALPPDETQSDECGCTVSDNPQFLAFDAAGDLFYDSYPDSDTGYVVDVDAVATGTVLGTAVTADTPTPVAAPLPYAQPPEVQGLAFDAAGNLDIAADNASIWQIESGGVGPAAELAFTTEPVGAISGNPLAVQPVVTVEDSDGNAVTSSAAQVTLSVTGATLSCTSDTVTAVSGVATFSGCQVTGAGGGYTITASATGLTSATSSNVTITAATAPVFTSAFTGTAVQGTSAGLTVTATGTPAPTIAEQGSGPAGVTFTSGGAGSGSGTLNIANTTAAGSYSLTFAATNSAAPSGVDQTFRLTVTPSGQPTGVLAQASATPGDASVSWTAPGGVTVTSYSVTPTNVTTGAVGTVLPGATSPLTLSDLVAGDAYTFTVAANLSAGGTGSATSNEILPVAAAPSSTATGTTSNSAAGSSTATIGSAGSSGSISATAAGEGSVTVATYAGNPVGAGFAVPGGSSSYDVAVAPGSVITALSFTVCGDSSGAIYWYNPLSQSTVAVSPAPVAVSGEPGCYQANLSSSSVPTVAELTGSVFFVEPQAQQISFSTTLSSATVGDTYDLSATATSGLGVAFAIDSSSTAICSLSDATVSFLAAGTCTIDATQSGDGGFLAAPEVTQSISVSSAPAPAPAPSPSPSPSPAPSPAPAPAPSPSPTPRSKPATSSPKPVLSITSGTVVIAKGRAPVVVSCATKSCSGTLDLVETVSVKVKKGAKTVTETSTVLLAAATYNVAPKQKETVEAVLDRAGTTLFAQASKHPVKETVTTTPKGGSATERSVTVS